MVEFVKFIAGVVLSTTIVASAFAFILKSVASFGGSKPKIVAAATPRQRESSRARRSPQARKAILRMAANTSRRTTRLSSIL